MKLNRSKVAGICAAAVLACAGLGGAPAGSAEAASPLTVAEVNAAQEAWCDGLLAIATTHAAGGDY